MVPILKDITKRNIWYKRVIEINYDTESLLLQYEQHSKQLFNFVWGKDVMVGKASQRWHHLNWTVREGLSNAEKRYGHVPVIELCLMGSVSPFIAYSPFTACFALHHL